MKKRFSGHNNGEVKLSHREAAQRLNLNRNTVGRYFKELEEHRFIRMVVGSFLGPSGVGQTALWALEEFELNGQPATKAFMKWKKPASSTEKQKPRSQPKQPRPKIRDTSPPDTAPHCPAVIEFGTYLSKARGMAS